tara:strand:+ start:3983 stop:4222 length:240 start_codon:yes stop_codon:yes gene_type:complete
MAKGVPHFFKDGKAHGSDGMGAYHKMPGGILHSGATHTKSSKKLFHFNELSKTAKEKAKKVYDAFLKRKKKKSATKRKR